MAYEEAKTPTGLAHAFWSVRAFLRTLSDGMPHFENMDAGLWPAPLSASAEADIRHARDPIRKEIDRDLALLGVTSIAEITTDAVRIIA